MLDKGSEDGYGVVVRGRFAVVAKKSLSIPIPIDFDYDNER
jgi:hypothetical protein